MTHRFSIYSKACFLGIATLGIFTACQKEEFDSPGLHDNSVTGVIAKDGDYSLFTSALDKAELLQPLNDAGPFTVFAPSNAACQAGGISTATIDTVVGLKGKSYLLDLLTYHMFGNKVFQSVADNDSAKTNFVTLNGKQVYISQTSKGIMINGANLAATKQALNGVTFGIDKLLKVPSKTIYETLKADSRFTILVKLIDTVGVRGDLSKSDIGYGFFAPTNGAFEASGVTNAFLDDILKKQSDNTKIIDDSNKKIAQYKADTAKYHGDGPVVSAIVANMNVEKAKIDAAQIILDASKTSLEPFKSVLNYHTTPRVYFSGNLNTGDVRTLLGKTKTIKLNSGTSVTVNDGKGTTATVTEADIITSNGVIHAIDQVLKP